ncbi:MAG: cell envelope integrity protein TolA [Pseudomonadota bacterium]
MDAAAERLEFAPPDEPAAVRGFVIAVIAHLLLAAALTWGINWKKDVEEVAAEAELWSALPQQAAPPAPVPAPPPPAAPVPEPAAVKAPPPPPVPKPEPVIEPPPQRDAQIVIEREKRKQERLEEKRLEQEAQKKAEAKRRKEEERREELAEKKAAEKAAQKASAAKAAEKKLAEKRAAELAADKAAEKAAAEDRRKDELAKAAKSKQEAARLEAQRKENIARMMQSATGGDGAPSSGGTARRASGPSASYGGRVQARVRPYIVFPEDAPGNPQAEVEVRTSPDGTIVGSRIVKPSGVKAWDDAVLAALTKAEVLPRDVDGRVPTPLVIVFKRRN